MRILVSTSLLSPYRVDWLGELGKYAEVHILYLNEGNAERDTAWLSKRSENCTYRLMHGRNFPKIGKISNEFIREVRTNGAAYDVIVLDGYGYADQLRNLWYLKRKKIPFYVNIDGMVENKAERAIVRALKKKIISAVPYFLCGSRQTAKQLEGYGAKAEHIFRHPFTSLFEKDLFAAPASQEEKTALRQELGIKEEKVVISVGRFSYMGGYGKGYDVLLRAAEKLPKQVGWYIIGGKPTEEFVRMTEQAGLDNVHYIEHTPKEELKKYYRAADLFVLMTVGDVWGLVINEAMACGLPVITTDKCVAGVEMVEEAKSGYIVPVGDDAALVGRVQEILMQDGCAEQMGAEALRTAGEYTIENMAAIHMEIFRGKQ